MALSKQVRLIGNLIEAAAASSEKAGLIRGPMAKFWDCGAVTYAWPTGPQEKEIHAKVTVTVSVYQTAGARLAAVTPVRVEMLVQAYRINPRVVSEPIRAWSCDLQAEELPEQKQIEVAFEETPALATRLVDSLKVAGHGRHPAGERAARGLEGLSHLP